MKKVALVTCYFMYNYGSQLQAYATQRIFDKLGIENEIIQCVRPINYMQESKLKYTFHKVITFDIHMKLARIKLQLIRKFIDKNFDKLAMNRDRKFEEFIKSNYNLSPKYTSFEELQKNSDNYRAFIVGSDQLWRPDSISHGYYTLDFVPDNILKISYSTSFGINEMPKYQVKKCEYYLNRFDLLSTREKSGKKIIEKYSNKPCSIVADPTLMLDSTDWEKIMPNKRIIEEKYVFCYFLGTSKWHREFAQKIKKITGYKIVSILHTDEYIKKDNDFPDYAPFDIGPGEFIKLIKDAEFVCTDSFHCTVFSIIFNKLFFTFNRFDSSKKQSTNTRIDSLLSILHLERRRVLDQNYELDILLKESINYCDTNQYLKELRHDSNEYLNQIVDFLKTRED